MEETTEGSNEGAKPPIEDKDPEAELTKSDSADPLQAVKDTTKQKNK